MHKEIEMKFLLNDEDREKLQTFLSTKSISPTKEETQDNFYYHVDDEHDLRIRQTDTAAYLILKKGWMHKDDREEIEVEVDRDDFDSLDRILISLGYEYDTKWHRERKEYKYKDFSITIDFNAGYGWVGEIEKLVEEGEEKQAKEEINSLAETIGVTPTPQEVFDKMYEYYKENWEHYYESGETFTLEDIK